MIIELSLIPEIGKTYAFDQNSEDLQGSFTDLIDSAPFKVNLTILPVGNTFSVNGNFSSGYREICSRCGHEIEVPLQGKINEMLVLEEERPRQSQSVHGQNSVKFNENQTSVTYINSLDFNLAEFIHEVMAVSMGLYPKCSDVKKCESQRFSMTEAQEKHRIDGHPAFQVLGSFKLKH